MKNYKSLTGSISLLIGAVIMVLAFVRSNLQIWLLIGIFAVWGIWAVSVMLTPYLQQHNVKKRQQKQAAELQTYAIGKKSSWSLHSDDRMEGTQVGELLLRHVNHRISAYLRAAYPDVTWEWCEKDPAALVAEGGTGRIRVFGVPDFNFAEIRMDRNARIECSMVKITPLSQALGTEEAAPVPPNQQPVDPQIWYEVQGRQVLEQIIADLNSRGHSSLTLYENGEIHIDQGTEDVTKDRFPSFPAKVYWPRLLQVFEQEGLAASVTAAGIEVSW